MTKPRRTILQRARARMISGFLLIVPTAVTIFVARFIYGMIQDLSRPVTNYLYKTPFLKELIAHDVDPIPGARVVLTILLTGAMLYLFGFISTTYITRKVYDAAEGLVLRIPFIKDVYVLTKQVIEMLTSERQPAFKQIALFEYPQPGTYAMGFVTGQTRVPSDPERPYSTVLMPFAPIPTQLILMIVPTDKLQLLDIPVEQGVKILMSGGALIPAELTLAPRPAELAERAITRGD